MNIVTTFLKEIGFNVKMIIVYSLITIAIILLGTLVIGLIIDQIKHGGKIK